MTYARGDILRVKLIGGPADGMWFALPGEVRQIIVPVPLWGSTGQAVYDRQLVDGRTVLVFIERAEA